MIIIDNNLRVLNESHDQDEKQRSNQDRNGRRNEIWEKYKNIHNRDHRILFYLQTAILPIRFLIY